MRNVTSHRGVRYLVASIAAGSVVSLMMGGCAQDKPTTRPSSWGDQALSDPYNFNPKMDASEYDVSGGGLGHFDKDAFKRDLDSVLNP